jgi:hypothetical protein
LLKFVRLYAMLLEGDDSQLQPLGCGANTHVNPVKPFNTRSQMHWLCVELSSADVEGRSTSASRAAAVLYNRSRQATVEDTIINTKVFATDTVPV